MRFTENDVVRHPLVQSVIRAYDKHESRTADVAEPTDPAKE